MYMYVPVMDSKNQQDNFDRSSYFRDKSFLREHHQSRRRWQDFEWTGNSPCGPRRIKSLERTSLDQVEVR
jgi:hypothetical protein